MRALPYLAFAFIILGAKFVLIASFGNATPFWDQWDAEAAGLYQPWLEHTLRWQDLFAAHNEHRIVTTRIVALLIFILNGNQWNPILQMGTNAVLHVLALILLLYFLAPKITEKYKLTFFIFATFLFTVPYGYENTLSGFQTQFYLLLLFSFIFLWAITRYEPLSTQWWLGLLCGLLSCLSLASGALTLAAGMGLIVGRWITGARRDKTQIAFFIVLLIGFLIAVLMTPTIQGHAVLKAKSLLKYIGAVGEIISWPTVIPLGLLLYAPMVLFLFKQLREKRTYNDISWFVFAISIWIIGQILSTAYGRNSTALSSRYLDIFALGVLINFVCLLLFFEQKNISRILVFLWVMAIFWGGGIVAFKASHYMQQKASYSKEQEKNVRGYLLTKNFSYLEYKSSQAIPHSDANRLKSLLDTKTIQKFLPKNLMTPSNNATSRKSSPHKISARLGVIFISIGLGLFFWLRLTED